VSSLAERLYLVDVGKMKLGDEIGLPANLRSFAPLPDGRFLSIHNHGKRDSILTWLV
jgi:hypothetical protein